MIEEHYSYKIIYIIYIKKNSLEFKVFLSTRAGLNFQYQWNGLKLNFRASQGLKISPVVFKIYITKNKDKFKVLLAIRWFLDLFSWILTNRHPKAIKFILLWIPLKGTTFSSPGPYRRFLRKSRSSKQLDGLNWFWCKNKRRLLKLGGKYKWYDKSMHV